MQTIAARHPPAPRRTWWPVAKRGLAFVFFAAVAWLLVRQARTIDWRAVGTSMAEMPVAVLLLGALLAGGSHALYSTFDLFGRHLTGHHLHTGRVMLVTFISYAFNLNFGALVGGIAFRYRLYARLGLGGAVVTRVLTMSMLTNWLGYLVLAGLVFLLHPIPVPPTWPIDSGDLRWLGFLLLGTAAAYLLACATLKRRRWTVRGHEVILPSGRLALLQLAVSMVNWMLIAGIVFVLLQGRAEYAAVLGVLLAAAVAGVIAHVPAGLGVLEAVFVALLSPAIPAGELLATLIVYRALYYLAPLAVASAAYLWVETRARNLRMTH